MSTGIGHQILRKSEKKTRNKLGKTPIYWVPIKRTAKKT